ncbi:MULTISPECIES: alanine racemase [Staphylococcus]|uniref:alanine racemase n=1 Tax=Staphylococcus TaxID=1279 RepID=UPI000763FB67|nr:MULTISPECIES: alanine racemase [Staphylococcus]OFM17924.1 alanine racemase [Staphylococcus sp. HMSC059E03]OFN22650.1 alanine racemase [Staphylococcus sp. HMSC055C03]OFU80281.1 alanine racemase [Staphylococcus sp. HMSC10C03]OFV04700.1 alanine racemase [Staphylococcus sp. HMSC12H08]OHR55891.1 alanine racemase [Staphylococcus sp. HMSC070A03]
MADKFYRPTYLKVDLEAILKNYRVLGKLQPNKTVMPVIKANAYGLGSVKVAHYLEKHGAEFFAVATLDEAIELRMHGIDAKILILGVVMPNDINKAIQHRVALTVPSYQWLEALIEQIEPENKKDLWLHVKIDTGMGRLGIKTLEDYQKIVDTINQHDQLVFEGVFTHFAQADEDSPHTHEQYQVFEDWVNTLPHPPYVHSQNSAGTILHEAPICNMVRTGISLYGYYPSEYVEEVTNAVLYPSAYWATEIMEIKRLNLGDTVSYGSTFTADRALKIAILGVGYADGFPRMMQGATVEINGHHCEIIGRVCMDQMMVVLPEDDTFEVGDTATLLNREHQGPESLTSLAHQQQTINYEVLCRIGRRVPRIYEPEKEFDIVNELQK